MFPFIIIAQHILYFLMEPNNRWIGQICCFVYNFNVNVFVC